MSESIDKTRFARSLSDLIPNDSDISDITFEKFDNSLPEQTIYFVHDGKESRVTISTMDWYTHVQASFETPEHSMQGLIDWFVDNLESIVKNHVAMEVYEKTLSHKVMPTEDWKIDIRSTGPSADATKWNFEWTVQVETQPTLITGSYDVSFQTMVAECMKTALSR